MNSQAEGARHLARLAEKLRDDPAYLAATLHVYQEQEGLDDASLARSLRLEVGRLPRLWLCKRPLPESTAFAEEVRQIASYTGADPGALAQMIRNVDSTQQMKNLPSSTATGAQERSLYSAPGLLAAARDGNAEDSDDPSDGTSREGDEPHS